MLFLTLFSLGTYIITGVLCNDFKDVVTEQGPVRGFKLDDDNAFSFYGIPYATAPTGEDRFKDALPPPTWTEVFNATNRDIVCPQYRTDHGTRILDCLVINVFIPANATGTNLPVVAYIHGGEYQYGVGRQMLPTNGFVQHGVVFVNFNFRVSMHGLLCLNTEFAPGNVGAKDQVLALKWVQRNIAQFGGNPKDVTLAGSSSGAEFVDLHIVSPMSAGLFNKASTEGGSGFFSEGVTSDPLQIAENFANQFGVYTDKNVTMLEEFYRSLTDEQLNIRHDTAGYLLRGFTPCLEVHDLPGVEKFMTEYPIDVLRQGKHNKVTYMTAFTPYEGMVYLDHYATDVVKMQQNFSQYLPIDVPYKNEVEREAIAERVKQMYFPTGEITVMGHIAFYSDISFIYGSYSAARFQSLYEKSYIYLFTYVGSLNLPLMTEYNEQFHLNLPAHVVYSLYLYLHYTDIYGNMTASDHVMEEKLRLIFYNFCKHGNPTPREFSLLDNITWVPVSPDMPYYAEVNNKMTLHSFPLQERFALWDDIYGYDYSRTSENNASKSHLICPFTILLSYFITSIFDMS